jgi:hypothetical protein
LNQLYIDHKGEFRIGEIEIFLEIAIDSYLIVKRLWSETSELASTSQKILHPNGNEIELVGIDHLDRLFFIQQERFKNEINGVISLATFYEALINEIGITELGSSYYSDHLDKLSIPSKWEVVLRLVYGSSITSDFSYFEMMKKVISTRNKLAHYKTKRSSGVESFEEFDKVLEDGLLNVDKLINKLKELDSGKEIIWFHRIEALIKRLNA